MHIFRKQNWVAYQYHRTPCNADLDFEFWDLYVFELAQAYLRWSARHFPAIAHAYDC